jgi:type II pantothenate kinase
MFAAKLLFEKLARLLSMILGLDFGMTNLDGAVLSKNTLLRGWRMDCPGASLESARAALAQGQIQLETLHAIGTTGGKHRELPETYKNIPLVKVGEAQAVGRGGLHMAGLEQALVVSAGTGTAMIAARGKDCQHITGSAVGGGTLLGLGKLCLGTADPLEIAALAAKGDPALVDGTLEDVIGGGIGSLPADATAVNLGRLVKLSGKPSREDLAAGLVTLVSQVIAVIALNAARAEGLERVVMVGHLPDLEPIQQAILRVWGFYGVKDPPIIPEQRGFATALGAALVARDTVE